MNRRTEFGFESTPEQDMANITYARAKSWQAILNDTTKPEQIDFVANRAIRELDKSFPYIGQAVFISGNGLHPEIDQENGIFLGESWGYSDGLEGIHNGFMTVYYQQNDTKKYKIMQQIMLGSKSNNIAQTLYQDLTLVAFFDLDSNIILLNQLDEIFYKDDGSIDFDRQLETLIQSSIALNSLIRSTKFRRQTRQKQQQEIDNLINIAENQSKIRGSKMFIEGQYAYINIFAKKINLLPIDIVGKKIGGMCLGIESIHSLKLRNQAIRRNSDLIDESSGICLMIDPDQETKDTLHIKTKKILYLPINQDLEFAKIVEQ